MSVTLRVEPPRPQRRATVAFRIILAIPHFVFGGFVLGMLAILVIVLAWFAALFTTRVPHGIADFLARILQYQARMYGYGQMLLTDRYPPFNVGHADYPVEVEFDEVGTFNRAAVFFRFFIQLPALLLVQIVVSGLMPALFVIWLVTLIAGRMPDSAHMALATVLRYQTRTYAYAGLVTTEFPGGLFGDKQAPPSAEPSTELPASPHLSRFVLSRAAKNLIILFVVLGSIFQAANIAVSVASFSMGFDKAAELDEHYADIEQAAETWLASEQSCGVSGGRECLRSVHTRFARAFDPFRNHVAGIEGSARDEAAVMLDDIDAVTELLNELSNAENEEDYLRTALQLQDELLRFERDYKDLYNAVLFG